MAGAAAGAVEVVNYWRCDPPTHLTTGNAGSTVTFTISGIEAGDLLFAGISSTSDEVAFSRPSGWQKVVSAGTDRRWLEMKVAGGSDNGVHAWTYPESGWSRSGTLVALRGAHPALVASGISAAGQTDVPDMDNGYSGAMLVAFNLREGGNYFQEVITANSPLVELVEHVSRGSRSYVSAERSCLAIEENLAQETITGRSFADFTAKSYACGVIVRPS